MSLHGCSILIVESEVSSFLYDLQEAIEQTGAQSLAVRDPYTGDGAERMKRFTFSAAVVNAQHQAAIKGLDIPVVVYGHGALPARCDVIVARLSELLETE